ncbi:MULTISPECIES: type I-C CRISPR-associated protein Cas8c/Csd1 [unclassified Halomonas]|uniref:type I-C CRISPR-associated protein Cas8c/Csd1 n=1 Tax=unclassified Halomonas TaxID=2609666 RepID=UPI000990995E|nr:MULTISPECIES: type I-C CRISPR-associated protein Cas8c/Csd1 [unclassified Halomonas]AQU84715.1 type I-C CRISPR-associated protein Cas8c/Csd1 [Halomonas sp. 'Soap Lake \
MSWMAKLYDTYPHIQGVAGNTPWPVAHVKKNAHVEVTIDEKGNFLRVKVLEGDDSSTLIPVTEKSGARTGNIDPHPLCEELSYLAFDLNDGVKKKEERNKRYLELLNSWCESDFSHAKAIAIRDYISIKRLWTDVSRFISFPIVFKANSTQKIEANKCFVRWRVEASGDLITGTWEDLSLIESWVSFEKSLNPKIGFCHVTGEESRLAKFHPKFIRNAADGARLITQNDWEGFTFLGRLTDSKKEITEKFNPSQVSEVSYEVTQKAHNALRWLISNQANRNGDQVLVAWAVSGKPRPDPLAPTWDLDNFDVVTNENHDVLSTVTDLTTDLGQNFAKALGRYMAGYFDGRIASLKDHESIVVMGLDSATPGRMAVIYYRDFMARDYVKTIEKWHLHLAWPQRVSKEIQAGGKKPKTQVYWPVSAPSPWNILQAAYGDVVKSNEELKKSLYERIMPCILEGRPLPIDLVNLAVTRASNRNNSEHWEWERNLGVACALYRGFRHPERQPDSKRWREYKMSLDLNYTGKDYLYGRLLAVAERIEEMAMFVAKEPSRTTHASRLMQRFADRPASTWLNIETALGPYQQRLRTKIPPLEAAYKRLLDDITDTFDRNDFSVDKRLNGEYLLGFHCQRKWLRDHKLKNGEWVIKSPGEPELTVPEGEE